MILYIIFCCLGGLVLQSLIKINEIDTNSNQTISLMGVLKTFLRKEIFRLMISIMSSVALMILVMEGTRYYLSSHAFEGTILSSFLYSSAFLVGFAANKIIIKLYGTAEKYIYTKFGAQ